MTPADGTTARPRDRAADIADRASQHIGGQIVVTRFECPAWWQLLLVLALHVRLGPTVRRRTTGLLGIRMFIRWRARVVYNVSLWQDFASIYSMGNVPLHVAATRLTGRFGIGTQCGVYQFAGDWRPMMFGGVGDLPESGVLP